MASLVLLEVRKAVGGVLSPRGRDLNVLRFLLDDHEPLINIAKWELQMNGEVYTFMDDDPLQTQLEFGAELTHTKQIIILAKNKEAILGALVEDIEIKGKSGSAVITAPEGTNENLLKDGYNPFRTTV